MLNNLNDIKEAKKNVLELLHPKKNNLGIFQGHLYNY